MEDVKMTDEELIKAFHAMWDNFPEAVMINLLNDYNNFSMYKNRMPD